MSEHREFKHKRREFKHREEESHSPVLDHEEREGGPARGVDGVDTVAGDLALPATISSSIWHEEEERKQGGDLEEIKGEWSRAQQDPPKERDRPCDDEHSKIRRGKRSTKRRYHDLPEERRLKVHDKHDLPKGRTIIDT